MCFKFSIKHEGKQSEGSRTCNTESWNKYDIVKFIQKISAKGNKGWKKCIEVVLENDLDHAVLKTCDPDDLKELGMPKIHAKSLLRRLMEVPESSHHVSRQEEGIIGEVVVDSAERPTASELLQQIEQWSKTDDFPTAPGALRQEIKQDSTEADCKLLIESDVQCQSEQKRRKISSPVVTEKNYDLGDIY